MPHKSWASIASIPGPNSDQHRELAAVVIAQVSAWALVVNPLRTPPRRTAARSSAASQVSLSECPWQRLSTAADRIVDEERNRSCAPRVLSSRRADMFWAGESVPRGNHVRDARVSGKYPGPLAAPAFRSNSDRRASSRITLVTRRIPRVEVGVLVLAAALEQMWFSRSSRRHTGAW